MRPVFQTGYGGPFGLTAAPIEDGAAYADVNRVSRTRQYRPGNGGLLQRPNTPGWHLIDHAGRVEGIVMAHYILQGARQLQTQAGVRPALVNVYSVQYASE